MLDHRRSARVRVENGGEGGCVWWWWCQVYDGTGQVERGNGRHVSLLFFKQDA